MAETAELIKGVEERRQRIREEIIALVESENERSLKADNKSALTLAEPMDADALEKHANLCAAWERADKELEILDADRSHSAQARAKEELLAKAPNERERQARVDIQAVNDLLAAGTGDYKAARIPVGGTDRTLELPQPLILRDVNTGKNVVHPVPAVFSESSDGQLDEEASWRAAAIISEDKRHQYELSTGNRKYEAITDIDSDTIGSLPEISVDLHRYMIIRNTVGQYCTIHQTAGVNDLNIPRRTTVPKATIIGTRANYGQSQAISEQNSGYSYITLRALKYAFYTGASFEALRDLSPWSLAAQIVEDGGIGLANGMGEHVVDGTGPAVADGAGSEPTGILTATNNSAQTVTLSKKLAEAFTDASLAKRLLPADLMGGLKALGEAYGNSPNLRFLMRFENYIDLVTSTDLQGQPIFFNRDAGMQQDPRGRSILSMMVATDQNMPVNKATDPAWVFGDLKGHVVRYAGGARVDRSDEVRFLNDDIVWRFIQCMDAGQIDANAMKQVKWPAA